MTDIFNGADQAPVTQEPLVPNTPVVSTVPPELAEYVGVGKKYATIDDVHRAFPNAQKHISTLEEENRQIKEELAKRKTAEELLQDIQNNITPVRNGDTIPPKVDMPDISSLVRQEMERVQVQETYKVNQSKVVDAFTKAYGDKARDQYKALAESIGVPLESLNQLALTSPNAVFKLAGLQAPAATTSGVLQSDVTKVTTSPDNASSSRVPLNGSAKDDANAIAIARAHVMKQFS